MTLYTRDCSHYSITKNASIIGVGGYQVCAIKTNDKGEMLASNLNLQIKNDIAASFQPFFVNALAGTTALCAFDNAEKLSNLCKKYDLWLHLDGAYCGSVIFSETYKDLVKGDRTQRLI